jgi:hypothetical protein
VFSGAISSLPHWTQLIPNRERGLDAFATIESPPAILGQTIKPLILANETFVMLKIVTNHFGVSTVSRYFDPCRS